MPRQRGMNPILLKTLIQLAASNKKPAPTGTVGSDAHLKNRIVLFSDEAVTLPDWGISGLPAMVLGAAPQTCLFVSDLVVDPAAKGEDATNDTMPSPPNPDQDTNSPHSDEDANDATTGETVSFSLTISSPPAPNSSLKARTIVWKLSLPVASYRDVQTGANSASVHAPVVASRITLGGVERDVEIGLLEMGGLEQPLLIGKDTLADKFLIRPDRPKNQTTITAPTVDLTPKPSLPDASSPPGEAKQETETKSVNDSASDSDSGSASTSSADHADNNDTTSVTQPDKPEASQPEKNGIVDTSKASAPEPQDNGTPDTPQQSPPETPIKPEEATTPDTTTVTNGENEANGANGTDVTTPPASTTTVQDTAADTTDTTATTSVASEQPSPPTTSTTPEEHRTEPT